jgi:hypothetical protein
LKKTFAEIAATIAILLIFTSFAYNLIPPANSAAGDTQTESALTVTGLVENPLSLNWSEIAAMPKTTVNATLFCVDFPNTVVAQGNWTGVKLGTLLEEAKPLADAVKIGFHASDGYSTDLPVQAAMRDDVILAYEKDGVPLNDLRLVVPGEWGYKWISQLTNIELVNYNFLGFWESQGYSDAASISGGSGSGASQEIPNGGIAPYTPTTPPSTTPAPSPSTPPPTTSPAPSDQPTLNPQSSKDLSIPTEAIYAIVAAIVAVVLVVGLMFVRKRTK